ncbi:hypothetical protein LXL04_039550 [Taraxacum kok-saghyz]
MAGAGEGPSGSAQEAARAEKTAQAEDHGGWQQVRRRKGRFSDHLQTMKISSSFFFQNFPEDLNEGALWKTFQNYGTVVDVYIPKKRDVTNRKFGFVRFSNISTPAQCVVRLQNIWIGSFKVRVSVARYQRNTSDPSDNLQPYIPPPEPRPQPHHATKPQKTNIKMCSDAASFDHMQLTLVGVTENFQALMNVNAFTEVEGCPNIDMRYLGGLKMILEFNGKQEKKTFLTEAEHIWKQWFKELYPWNPKENFCERIASILIYGLPLQAWCEEAFSVIAATWGTVIIPEECATDNTNLAYGRVGILTKHPGLTSQCIEVTIDEMQYKIIVIEDTLESTRLSPVVASNDDASYTHSEHESDEGNPHRPHVSGEYPNSQSLSPSTLHRNPKDTSAAVSPSPSQNNTYRSSSQDRHAVQSPIIQEPEEPSSESQHHQTPPRVVRRVSLQSTPSQSQLSAQLKAHREAHLAAPGEPTNPSEATT